MKAAVVATLVGAAVASPDVQQKFTAFMKEYKKEYLGNELFTRFNVFKQNLALIEEHNSQNLGWTMGINQFADLTAQEFEAKYLKYTPSNESRFASPIEGAPAAEVDWVATGKVQKVKDQGQCGSCWAFSTTGGVESALAVSTGELLDLSEQQLVDCSGSSGNQGCNGGLMDNAFKWIQSNGGIAEQKDYPYKATDGTCKTGVRSAAGVTGFTDVPAKSETGLATAIAKQPVSIAVDARKWQLYSGGVFDGCGALVQLDHGVLLVGVSDSGNYWKVKNSWGTSWGEKGFIRLTKGKNECGLSNAASYPAAKRV